MKLTKIFEALRPEHEQDAVRLTFKNNIQDTTNPKKHADLKLSDKWIQMRNKFLDQHPEAKAMFAKGGEKREYQIRFPGVVQNKNTDAISAKIIDQLIPAFRKIPNQVDSIDDLKTEYEKKYLSDDDYRKILQTLLCYTSHTNFRNHAMRDYYIAGVLPIGKWVGEPGQPKKLKVVMMSIGKVMKQFGASSAAIQDFEKDPIRIGKNKPFDIIVTGHPIDVYGASTGRGWTSCANLYPKDYEDARKRIATDDDDDGHPYGFEPSHAAAHIGDDINNHVHLAYLVTSGGDIDHDAVARVSYKLHNKLGGISTTLLSENRVYGNAPSEFLTVANEIVGTMFKIEDGVYCQHENSYIYDSRLKFHGDVKLDKHVLGEAARHFNEITDDDEAEHFAKFFGERIRSLDEHGFSAIMDTIMSSYHTILDVLESDDNGELEEGEEGINSYAIIVCDPSEIFDNGDMDQSSFYDWAMSDAVRSKYFDSWWYGTTVFQNCVHNILEHVVEIIEYDGENNTNVDDALHTLNNAFHRNSGGSKIKLSERQLKSTKNNPVRFLAYIAANFKALADMLDVSDIGIQSNDPMENAAYMMKELIDAFHMDHGHEIPESMLREMLGLVHIMNRFVKHQYSLLDWLVYLEEHIGSEHISDINDMHSIRSWLEQVVYEMFPKYIDVSDDGKLVFERKTEDAFNGFMDKLKTKTDQKNIPKILDLIDFGDLNIQQ